MKWEMKRWSLIWSSVLISSTVSSVLHIHQPFAKHEFNVWRWRGGTCSHMNVTVTCYRVTVREKWWTCSRVWERTAMSVKTRSVSVDGNDNSWSWHSANSTACGNLMHLEHQVRDLLWSRRWSIGNTVYKRFEVIILTQITDVGTQTFSNRGVSGVIAQPCFLSAWWALQQRAPSTILALLRLLWRSILSGNSNIKPLMLSCFVTSDTLVDDDFSK